MATTLGWNLLTRTGQFMDSVCNTLSPHISALGSSTAGGLIARTIGGSLTVWAGYNRAKHIHERAEQANPDRSRFRKWLTHPVKRCAFAIPAILWGSYIGTLAASTTNPALDGQVAYDNKLMENFNENKHTVQALQLVHILPMLSDCYEITKHSLKSLWETYQKVNMTISDKLYESFPSLANLAFEALNIKTAISGFSTETIRDMFKKNNEQTQEMINERSSKILQHFVKAFETAQNQTQTTQPDSILSIGAVVPDLQRAR